jgi:tRNA A-37 threonylcarbamoyl transferase component Bud32
MSCNFEEMFGEIAGHGAQATVYAKGEYAVKLYRDGYPKRNVFSEAYILANLESMGFPSPKVHEVLSVNGRYGLRMDRVKGKIMSEELNDPAKSDVELQRRLQEYDKTGWAPDLKQRLHDDLDRSDRLSAVLKKKLMEELGKLPDGQALCHCDFHAGNVFSDGEEYTIIDLLQICRGDPAADATCSYVSYSLVSQDLAEAYLDRYCKKSGISRKRVQQWLRVYAGTLLGQVPEQFTPIIERFIAGEDGATE